MRRLYHMWLSPFSRKVRVVLDVKRIDFELKVERVWERREKFLKLNPAGTVPVFVEEGGTVIPDSCAIVEYLDEAYPEPGLYGDTPLDRAESRRLSAWFDGKFHTEVGRFLIAEKVQKIFLKMGQPDSKALRCAARNLKTHLAYVDYLIARRNYLAGNQFSMADITAAAHVSVVDYLGDINWDDYPDAKDWYLRVKSRRSFRSILKDRIPGLPPSRYYDKLDF